MNKPKKPEVKSKKSLDMGAVCNSILSYISMVLLAAFAYIGVVSLVEAKPAIATGLGIITVLLLVKTALKK